MSNATRRITDGAQLGLAKRSLDMLFGASAVAPILAIDVIVWVLPTSAGAAFAVLAVMWSGALLAFFAGVRRGLTFSERGGGRLSELATMLWLFVAGVGTIVFESPILGAVGFASLAVLDTFAARRAEAPAYFSLFRPPQMAVAAAGLLAILAREL